MSYFIYYGSKDSILTTGTNKNCSSKCQYQPKFHNSKVQIYYNFEAYKFVIKYIKHNNDN